MSLNIGFAVSSVGGSMIGILVGYWDDKADIFVTISIDLSSDDDWELMSFIPGSTSSKNGGSTSLNVWSSVGGNGGYLTWFLVLEVLQDVLCY